MNEGESLIYDVIRKSNILLMISCDNTSLAHYNNQDQSQDALLFVSCTPIYGVRCGSCKTSTTPETRMLEVHLTRGTPGSHLFTYWVSCFIALSSSLSFVVCNCVRTNLSITTRGGTLNILVGAAAVPCHHTTSRPALKYTQTADVQ